MSYVNPYRLFRTGRTKPGEIDTAFLARLRKGIADHYGRQADKKSVVRMAVEREKAEWALAELEDVQKRWFHWWVLKCAGLQSFLEGKVGVVAVSDWRKYDDSPDFRRFLGGIMVEPLRVALEDSLQRGFFEESLKAVQLANMLEESACDAVLQSLLEHANGNMQRIRHWTSQLSSVQFNDEKTMRPFDHRFIDLLLETPGTHSPLRRAYRAAIVDFYHAIQEKQFFVSWKEVLEESIERLREQGHASESPPPIGGSQRGKQPQPLVHRVYKGWKLFGRILFAVIGGILALGVLFQVLMPNLSKNNITFKDGVQKWQAYELESQREYLFDVLGDLKDEAKGTANRLPTGRKPYWTWLKSDEVVLDKYRKWRFVNRMEEDAVFICWCNSSWQDHWYIRSGDSVTVSGFSGIAWCGAYFGRDWVDEAFTITMEDGSGVYPLGAFSKNASEGEDFPGPTAELDVPAWTEDKESQGYASLDFVKKWVILENGKLHLQFAP